MPGGELKKSFRELEEAVDLLLKRSGRERPVSGEKKFSRSRDSTGNVPELETGDEAAQLIRRALQRLKSL